jgi:16S rRNA (guanine966-N2)-methyltransferase
MLAAMDVRPGVVLDLYAGTGALGIEALSRGAGWVDFVERNRSACAVIHANLERVGYRGQAQILCSPVSKAVPKLSRTYDLVFADPPYVDLDAIAIFDSPDLRRRLAPQAVIVYEHGRRQVPPPSLGDFQLRRTRSHGSSTVSFYADTASEDCD